MTVRKSHEGFIGGLVATEDEVALAFQDAITEINKGGGRYVIAAEVDLGYTSHPELKVVRCWLESMRKETARHEVLVIHFLCVAIRSEWADLPKLTKAEHNKLYQRIRSLCDELRDALNETGSFYMRGGGWGLMGASVDMLLTKPEASQWSKLLSSGYESERDGDVPDIFPPLDDLLKRLAAAAERLESQGPVHAQPNKRGAESGYFVRRMGALLKQRYGKQPADVLAALATAVLSKDMDRELASKLLKQPERSR